MKAGTSTHVPSPKLTAFLKNHYIKPPATSTAELDERRSVTIPQEKTNTRIADRTGGISGGTYHIPDNEYPEFLRLYHEEIVSKGGVEYLTERQLESDGPIAIDVDLRYTYDTSERQHSKEHVVDLVCLYLEELKTMYQFDEGTHIPVFVFEKDTVNRVNTEGKEPVTKDGIHMLIGLRADRTVQTILRERVVARISSIWEGLPITNTWSDVFDEGISKGCTNWQLYGSCKPHHEPYRLKYVFDVQVDPADGEFQMPEVPTEVYDGDTEKFMQLSVRYREHPGLFMTNTFIAEYNEKRAANGGGGSGGARSHSAGILRPGSGVGGGGLVAPVDVLNIRTKEQLDAAVAAFLESISVSEYDLHDAYTYTMALPKSYYGAGSFTKWIRVGWALRNISPRLFVVWVAFSAQADNFSYTGIRTDLWDRWQGFDAKPPGEGVTKRSIMYWLKQDDPSKYKEIHKGSVEYVLDCTLENAAAMSSGTDRRPRGSGDYDIALVLHRLFGDEYKCVSIKGTIWYHFKQHRWEEVDSGTTLRMAISEELRDIYSEKMSKLLRQRIALKSQETAENGDKLKMVQLKLDTVTDIIQRLSRTKEKQNIMAEAKDLFYDKHFLDKLDNDPYLLCFANGVVDFREKRFRKGVPEDYLSKCTNIDYTPIDPHKHQGTIAEIEDFMHKLFPNPELHQYMWEHLASTLIGNNMNQTFNMYIGVGSNGKSILVTLMEKVLGNYKGDVPLTLLTQGRTRIGGLAPELVALKGIRYAVMQEPSKGDRINEGVMKQVTGGDPVQARAPYMPQMITYIPQFKLVVCSNDFMEIRAQDNGTWRRIRVVDFESLFTENPVEGDDEKPYQFKLDKTIKEKFEFWKEVFAAMLVNIAYEMNGNVNDCEKVLASSHSYMARQDFIAEFMNDRIEHCETGCIQKDHLGREFREWFNGNFGGKPPNTRDVSDAMEKKYGRLINGIWKGIRFKRSAGGASIIGSDQSESGTIHTHLGTDEDVEIDLQEL